MVPELVIVRNAATPGADNSRLHDDLRSGVPVLGNQSEGGLQKNLGASAGCPCRLNVDEAMML